MNVKSGILIRISRKFVPKCLICNESALDQERGFKTLRYNIYSSIFHHQQQCRKISLTNNNYFLNRNLLKVSTEHICMTVVLCVEGFEDQQRPWIHDSHVIMSAMASQITSLNRLFGRRSKKTSKLCITGLHEWNSPVTGEFPAQRASDAENVSIWWRHIGSFNRTSNWVITHSWRRAHVENRVVMILTLP